MAVNCCIVVPAQSKVVSVLFLSLLLGFIGFFFFRFHCFGKPSGYDKRCNLKTDRAISGPIPGQLLPVRDVNGGPRGVLVQISRSQILHQQMLTPVQIMYIEQICIIST